MYNEVQLLVRNGPQVPGAGWGQGRLVEGNGNRTTGQVGGTLCAPLTLFTS